MSLTVFFVTNHFSAAGCPDLTGSPVNKFLFGVYLEGQGNIVSIFIKSYHPCSNPSHAIINLLTMPVDASSSSPQPFKTVGSCLSGGLKEIGEIQEDGALVPKA